MARLCLPHLASLDQKLDRLFHVGIDAEPLFIVVCKARAPLAAVFLASIAKKLIRPLAILRHPLPVVVEQSQIDAALLLAELARPVVIARGLPEALI